MAKKIKDNVDLVKDMMEHSQFGALAQAFIIDALTKQSNAVAKADPASINGGLVNPEAWVGVAKEIKAKMDAFYQRTN
jgi:hypothetical protein